MDNKVTNPETPVPKTIKLNDCDYLADILNTTKAIVHMESIATCEASNSSLNQNIHMMYDESEQKARTLFNIMFQNGWYPLIKADKSLVNDTITEFNQKLAELNSDHN